ncbi:MAG: DNA polymerase III subunit alpha, partial [Planctomycetes bacterium]|nr:DNA polymerase III subunit alpha [Planctomycetota bacterium]
MGTRPQFCHLHVHSHFSLLDGACRLDELVEAAATDEQPAIGITDHGNLFGAIPFYKACKKRGVRPIMGIEAYLAGKSRHERADSTDNPTYHMTLLAENDLGWKNLIKLSSISFREGFYRRPRIDREALQQYGSGIIALSGCLGGEVNQRILQSDFDRALRVVEEMSEILGPDNYFLEVMDNGYSEQPAANAAVLELSKRSGRHAVATNDVHYLKQADWRAQDILLCINTGKAVQEENRFKMEGDQLYLKTREEMARVFPDRLDVLERTVEIAERCNVTIDFDTYHLPRFDPETGETPEAMFERLCKEGLAQRYGTITDEIRERLAYETEIIKKLGFVSYFLITWDFLRHAREIGVPVGPGRGSAAGSIVAYCLAITDIDPLRYDLLFERFLNAERISMPDIDIDFCRDGRERVIEYVRNKYGEQNVSQIITFGTMASRGVIRDVGRALAIELREVDRIAKKVPNGPGASLRDALDTDSELQAIRKEDESKENLFEIGVKLEGLCRHASTHAAGVVIADRPLDEYVPLYRNGEDITTQWQMTDLEEVGLLKMDFLGLKTLTIIAEAERLILEQHGKKLDLTTLPLDDANTYALLSRGTTLGVFQLESDGMRELLARLKPSCFEDVIALIALYRPGPLKSGMADMY